jgi:hypothetical protein
MATTAFRRVAPCAVRSPARPDYLLDAMQAHGGTVDLVPDFAAAIPIAVIGTKQD